MAAQAILRLWFWSLSWAACTTSWHDHLPGDILAGAALPHLDIVSVSANRGTEGVTITITMAPGTSTADMDQMIGLIDIDADDDEETGVAASDEYAWMEVGPPYPNMGVDYVIDVAVQAEFVEPWYNFVDPELGPMMLSLGTYPLTRWGRVVYFTLPHCDNDPASTVCLEPIYKMAALIKNNVPGTWTDRIPNGAAPLSNVSAADFNEDGGVDQADFAHFAECQTGPELLQSLQTCRNADLDDDTDVDQDDFGILQRSITGSCE